MIHSIPLLAACVVAMGLLVLTAMVIVPAVKLRDILRQHWYFYMIIAVYILIYAGCFAACCYFFIWNQENASLPMGILLLLILLQRFMPVEKAIYNYIDTHPKQVPDLHRQRKEEREKTARAKVIAERDAASQEDAERDQDDISFDEFFK